MTIEDALRSIAGTFVLLSVVLAHYVSPWWLLFTAFIGLNLLQSGFTHWCPMMWLLEKAGLRHEGASESPAAQRS
ncbi:MAG: YgaP family membrane protein [Phycisphaerae bacterium]